MHRFSLIVFLVFALLACGASRTWEPMGPLGPTLQVVNTSSYTYKVATGKYTRSVAPNATICVLLPNTRTSILVTNTADGKRYSSWEENFMFYSGWLLELGMMPLYDMLSLRPTDRCKL